MLSMHDDIVYQGLWKHVSKWTCYFVRRKIGHGDMRHIFISRVGCIPAWQPIYNNSHQHHHRPSSSLWKYQQSYNSVNKFSKSPSTCQSRRLSLFDQKFPMIQPGFSHTKHYANTGYKLTGILTGSNKFNFTVCFKMLKADYVISRF